MLRHFSILLLLCVSVCGQITNINFGTTPDDRTGDTLRKAGSKINTNTAWLASQLGASTNASTTLSNLWRVSQDPVAPNLSTNWFNIATWGDSLTYGYGSTLPSSNSYPSVLAVESGYTVSNGGVSSDTSGQIKVRMLSDTASHVLPTIIWAGRNDVYTNSAANIIANIDAMIAALAAAGNSNRWLVLNVLNGDYGSFDAPGGAGYLAITNLNEQMRVRYGVRYVPIREALVAAYNPALPNDVIDHSLDIPPESLRFDQLHLTNSGYAAVARYVLTNYQSILRGDWPAFVSAKGLQIELASPPPIGITTANTGSFSDLYSPFVRVGGTANYKTFSLSGDYSSVQLNGNMIPIANNTYNIGYSENFLAWKNAYFSGTVFSTNFLAYQYMYTPNMRIGDATNYIASYLSGDKLAIQFTGKLAPSSHNTLDLGYSTALAWRNGYFSDTIFTTNSVIEGASYANVYYGNSAIITNITSTGTLTLTNSGNSARVMSDTDYRGYKYTGGALASGATADLLTIGSYAKSMSGILTVRTWSASSRGLYTYVLGIMGGGDAATITPTSFQQYGPTALTGTLTIVKDTPSGGTDTVRFTVGPNALTAIEFAWKPMLVDGSSTITGF